MPSFCAENTREMLTKSKIQKYLLKETQSSRSGTPKLAVLPTARIAYRYVRTVLV